MSVSQQNSSTIAVYFPTPFKCELCLFPFSRLQASSLFTFTVISILYRLWPDYLVWVEHFSYGNLPVSLGTSGTLQYLRPPGSCKALKLYLEIGMYHITGRWVTVTLG